MTPTPFWQLFLEGMLGPLILEMIKLSAWQSKTKITQHYSDGNYWIATSALFLLAGLVVAILNQGHTVTLLQAVQLGINAPAIAYGWATARSARGGRAGFVGSIDVAHGQQQGRLERLYNLMSW